MRERRDEIKEIKEKTVFKKLNLIRFKTALIKGVKTIFNLN